MCWRFGARRVCSAVVPTGSRSRTGRGPRPFSGRTHATRRIAQHRAARPLDPITCLIAANSDAASWCGRSTASATVSAHTAARCPPYGWTALSVSFPARTIRNVARSPDDVAALGYRPDTDREPLEWFSVGIGDAAGRKHPTVRPSRTWTQAPQAGPDGAVRP